jgi:hypothetical protein
MLKLNAFVYYSRAPINGTISAKELYESSSNPTTSGLSISFVGISLNNSILSGDVSSSVLKTYFNKLIGVSELTSHSVISSLAKLADGDLD